MLPGATGAPAAKLAPFTIPPCPTTGADAFAFTPYATGVRFNVGSDGACALIWMIVNAPELCGCHVPVLMPVPKLTRGTGGSPFENVAVTVALVTTFAQS